MNEMTTPAVPPTNAGKQKKRGSLARSITRTLLVFTLIPLILMAGAAYWRTSTMLRDQVVKQMQSLVSTQMDKAQTTTRGKQIRLDKIVRQLDFTSAMQIVLRQSPNSSEFAESRDRIVQMFAENPAFNLFLVIAPDGTVLVSSDKNLEGISLANSPLFETLRKADNESFGVYDFTPVYPGKFTLITAGQYRTSDQASRATIVGVSEEQDAVTILKSLVDLAPGAHAYFVTNFGGFIGLDPYTGQVQPLVPSSEQEKNLNQALAQMKETGAEIVPVTVEFQNQDGEPMLSQAVWLDALHTGVVLEVTKASIFGQLNDLIPFTLGVFAFSLIAMAIVVSWGINRVVKPILSLADISSKFAQGNWESRAVTNTNNEVGLLAESFNHMADQLSGLYQSLQEQVEERTRQIRTAAEVAQGLTSTFNLDELLKKTVQLIVERFGFYHAGIFMLDQSGRYASLRAAQGPSAGELLKRGHRLEVGSASIIGWVSANLKPRVASDVELDPIYRRNELLPETRAEAGLPIVLSGALLGVLDVQSTEPRTFDEEMIIVLQTVANQIAAAIQNTTLSENASLNIPEAERLYRAALQIAQASTEATILEAAVNAMKESPHPSAILKLGEKSVDLISAYNPNQDVKTDVMKKRSLNTQEIARHISAPMLVSNLATADTLPSGLVDILRDLGCQSGAFLPITSNGRPVALLLLGEQPGQPLSTQSVRPYTNISGMMSAAMEKAEILTTAQIRLAELEALATFNQTILSTTDVNVFYATLQEQVRRVIGDFNLVVAMYDAKTNSISIPYLYEDGNIQKVDPFPLGEGLTSILIRTRRPLLLVENTEKQALALGAKIHGKPAKSWMGVPLIIGEEAIGALIIQDLELEHRFDERDLHFLAELSRQMSGVIYNLRLLEQSRRSALQLQTAAEIARDISGSLNLDELLLRAVNLIRDRFDFYHASVFLLDLHNEFAVIREATGEAGTQLKRKGHKLGVGSQSIVGYVSGRGETLVVNDTAKDATFFANPILPDTRAEAAIPLKVGDRILGVLDVQSTQPFAFSEDNLRTLEILADQLAVAVVNTELFADTQEHLSQHRLLHHITTSAASGTTLEEALESTVKGLQVTLGGDRVTILMMDRERKNLELRASVGYSEEIASVHVPIGTGITGWVASHRKPLRVDDVTNDPRYISVSANTRSELALPLLYRNELLGVLNVESEQVAAYSENDEEMLGTLAGSLAAIMANARLLDQIRRQAERERLLYEITSKIRRSTDIQSILTTTASELSKGLGARRTQIKISLSDEKNGLQEEE